MTGIEYLERRDLHPFWNGYSDPNREDVAEAYENGKADGYNEGFDAGMAWTDTHPHWISVKDELPEVCVAVLTTTQHGTQRVGFYEDGWWLANTPDLVRMVSITHWMPLPEPPEHFADVSKKISGDSELPNNHTEKGGEQ